MDHQPTRDDQPHNRQNAMAGRFIGGVFGFVFFGIGVSVIFFLWSAPFGEFGSPPLFFRVVGSLIALAFVAFGGTFAFAAVTGVAPGAAARRLRRSQPVDYECPRCGAPLGSNVDVSPKGHVKCAHCDSWFNIHET